MSAEEFDSLYRIAPVWYDSAEYEAGNMVVYDTRLYVCRIDHFASPERNPKRAPDLWQRLKVNADS